MYWDLENTDIPIEKPKEVKELESMGIVNRESMPPREMDEKLEDSAIAIAKNYKQIPDANLQGCVTVVSVALDVTGSSLGGKFGDLMLSRSKSSAQHACKRFFPDEN